MEHKIKELGIYNFGIKKNVYTVFVDAAMGNIIEIKENYNEKIIADFINSLDDKNSIEYIIMGFHFPSVQAINEIIPNTTIVIDKYYVIEEILDDMQDKINTICKDIKQYEGVTITKGYKSLMFKLVDDLSPREYDKLGKLCGKYPYFIKVYEYKEAFVSIYSNATNYQEALNYFLELLHDWDTMVDAGFEVFVNHVLNWEKMVFGYFDCPYKNIDVENLICIIKELDREGRGYSFETLRDKVVLKNIDLKKTEN